MKIDGWRERLATATENSEKSMRKISLAAGRAEGYLHDLLNSEKKPSMTNLALICDALEISLSYVLYGLEMTESEEALLQAFSHFDDDQKEAFVQMAKSMVKKQRLNERGSD